MPNYPVPSEAIETEYEVKKSRFIARAAKAENREQAMAMLEQARKDYPDARHHCWAYLLGNPQSASSAAMSDDGEPSGTAGKPILNVLQHKGVGDVMLVVIRYFGGIKLGAGGLVRAYSASAQQAMELLPTEEQISVVEFPVQLDFSQEQLLRHWLSENQGGITDTRYEQQVTARVSIPEIAKDAFQAFAAAQGWVILDPGT